MILSMVPTISEYEAERWLNMIDSNKSGEIDNLELMISLLTDDDIDSIKKLENNTTADE